MSKIAELLKLAEQKKEDKPNLEIVAPVIQNDLPRVSKSKQEEIWVSKSKQVGLTEYEDVNREVGVSKSKEAQTIDETVTVDISPTKDFTKVSNSIMKRAIPEKYFRGLSKHTYDVLYQRTRGAIKPTRTIQLTKDELVRLTGLSKDAIKLHIKYLKGIGLLNSRPAIGIHAGWEYEIFVPEEIQDPEQVGVRQSKASQGKASEVLPLDRGENLPPLTHTNLVENKGTYETSKTSFKDNRKNDDESVAAFSEFFQKVSAACERITGKPTTKREAEKWGTLADLLILELETAAKKTDSISSVPAFLTEVLRRQFFVSRQQQSSIKQSKIKLDAVGKADAAGEYQIKPLDTLGREAALEQLREFAGDSFLEDFKKWYLEEDWQWLMKQLSAAEKTDAETQGSSDER